jgi:hypothetical protein
MNEGIKSGDSDDLGVVQNQGLYRASSAGARIRDRVYRVKGTNLP